MARKGILRGGATGMERMGHGYRLVKRRIFCVLGLVVVQVVVFLVYRGIIGNQMMYQMWLHHQLQFNSKEKLVAMLCPSIAAATVWHLHPDDEEMARRGILRGSGRDREDGTWSEACGGFFFCILGLAVVKVVVFLVCRGIMGNQMMYQKWLYHQLQFNTHSIP
jgi:hypothetical protein